MLITNDFILINLPKTGSTFARQVVSTLYAAKGGEYGLIKKFLCSLRGEEVPFCKELFLERTDFKESYNYKFLDQHGRYEQVPDKYKSRPVLSIVREPINRSLSFYEFGWWKNHPVVSVNEIRNAFPSFPDLDFPAFLEYQDFNIQYRDTGVPAPPDIGIQTITFIQFCFRNPKQAVARLSDEYIYSGEYKEDLPELILLRTEYLNRDLYKYFTNCGFTAGEIGFILTKPAVRPDNTSRKPDEERQMYLTEETRKTIRYKERYLYHIYSDYGIEYQDDSISGEYKS